MGTRSGDIDPAVTFHLKRVAGMSADEIDVLLNKKSGLVGLCGDNDMREIRRRVDEGDERAALAFDIYVHRLKKYIGAYSAVLAGWTPWCSRRGWVRTRLPYARLPSPAWRNWAWRWTRISTPYGPANPG